MKVIIVDDARVIREALSDMLEAEGIEVVATAPDAPTALEAVIEHRPDVVIVDLRLPGQDGDKLTAELLTSQLVDYVVVMSVDSSRAARQRARRAGAVLFIDMCQNTSSLGRKLRQLPASITPRLIPRLHEGATLICA